MRRVAWRASWPLGCTVRTARYGGSSKPYSALLAGSATSSPCRVRNVVTRPSTASGFTLYASSGATSFQVGAGDTEDVCEASVPPAAATGWVVKRRLRVGE